MTRRGAAGFTLIELMIVVAIVGVLAVLAIFGVRKYVANAKTAEARSVVGQIGKAAIMAFERDSGTTSTLGLGTSGARAQRMLCGTAANAVPTSITSIANKKYQSTPAEWKIGDATTGWACLSFSVENPQYFMYSYEGVNIDGATGTFAAHANGDLNGDAVTSAFTLRGAVDRGQARTAPTMEEIDSEE